MAKNPGGEFFTGYGFWGGEGSGPWYTKLFLHVVFRDNITHEHIKTTKIVALSYVSRRRGIRIGGNGSYQPPGAP